MPRIYRNPYNSILDDDFMTPLTMPEKNKYSYSENMNTLVDLHLKPHLRFNNLEHDNGVFVSMQVGKWFDGLQKQHSKRIQQQFKSQILKDFETVQHKESDSFGTITTEVDYSKCFELRIVTRDRIMHTEITDDYSQHPSYRLRHDSIYGRGSHHDLKDYNRLQSYELCFEIEIKSGLGGLRKQMAESYLRTKFDSAGFETFARKIKDKMFKDLTEQDIPSHLGIGNSADTRTVNQWMFDYRGDGVYIPTERELECGKVNWKSGDFVSMCKSRNNQDLTVNCLLEKLDNDQERLLDALEWLNQNGILVYAPNSDDNRGKKLLERRLWAVRDDAESAEISGLASSFIYLEIPAALEPEPEPEPEPVTAPQPPKERFVYKPQNPILSEVERRRLDNEKARELIKQRTQQRITDTLKKMKKSAAKP